MKKSLTILNIVFVFVFWCGCSEVIPKDKLMRSSGSPLEISMDAFESLIAGYFDKIESDKTLSKVDYVCIVRLYNTLSMDDELLASKANESFFAHFVSKCFQKAVTTLNFQITKGMCYYSKEYDLFLGCKPHSNSHYIIKQ